MFQGMKISFMPLQERKSNVLMCICYNKEEINQIACNCKLFFLAAADDGGDVKMPIIKFWYDATINMKLVAIGDIFRLVITGGLDSKLIMWDFSKGRPYKIVDFGILSSGVCFGNRLSFPPILFCSLAGNWCLNHGCSPIHALITLRLWPEYGCRGVSSLDKCDSNISYFQFGFYTGSAIYGPEELDIFGTLKLKWKSLICLLLLEINTCLVGLHLHTCFSDCASNAKLQGKILVLHSGLYKIQTCKKIDVQIRKRFMKSHDKGNGKEFKHIQLLSLRFFAKIAKISSESKCHLRPWVFEQP
nr:hypothetical protein CFP56_43330 [Quercus suber]